MTAADISDAERLLGKLRDLPPEKVAEVEDFIDFLRDRLGDGALVRAAAAASERSFASVWDNPDDAAYDEL